LDAYSVCLLTGVYGFVVITLVCYAVNIEVFIDIHFGAFLSRRFWSNPPGLQD
jgi:hypothetical protein